MKKILKQIFSMENKYAGLKKIKIITILFYKFEFPIRIKPKTDYMKLEKIKNLKITLNTKVIDDRRKNDIAICAIYKNEPDIREWIEYHKLIGFDRFYLYDNESTDNSREILEPYIDEGTVIYHYLPGRCMQVPAYRDAILRYKRNTKWMAIIDLDEYICPVEKDNIKDFLKDYEHEPAVGINWMKFDSNGYKTRPQKLVIEAYTRINKDINYWDNHHIKSIVKPKEVLYMRNPHYCFYRNNQVCVDENYNPIGNPMAYNSDANAFTSFCSTTKIKLNHYHTKSEEDYKRKIELGFADTNNERSAYDPSLNFEGETANDYVIWKYLPELKKRMMK